VLWLSLSELFKRMRPIRSSKNSGPGVSGCEAIAVPEPKAAEIVFRWEAAGIN
jgi:NADPH:quinone reductase-like Zn-dependent oxidoreductase